MSTKSNSAKDNELKADKSTLEKVTVKDFQSFGSIKKEDLNDYFDDDVMSSLSAVAKRERRIR
ncbi:MAG: hypothetical protein COW01_14345 [Bdellovibrionales bacterium CG12_big_fil_rev_8_21_14_0_65_38_15]|nr:MAG: hypothetical protein COW79_17165 [Bdellovibrionales bacterium CG22_combo_CG10-13_8_21_14_all_38_13]PIQ53454.1 MAG: hypothetical protein COW01_14345 [Bdellovibrionales bacterium CG12_big_fil_rev_8_21_14_0_65_38_15]PIR30183.1 MAG: hypothetical protein COV38_05410 [Bdellovibrionales bacterium CG11_big_fil_rev_8_21_14_0_20_38_13]